MSYQIQTINGVKVITDSSAPGVPITTVPGDGGSMVANNAAALLSLQGKVTRDIVFGLNGNLVVGTDKTNHVPLNYAATAIQAYAIAKTAPTGSSAIFVIKKNGSTVVATLTMNAGTTTATATGLSTTLSIGDYLSIDVTQIGSTVPGANCTITLTIAYT